MRKRRFEGNSRVLRIALQLVLIATSLAVVMGCVLIPYPTRPDVARSEAITIADDHTLVTLGPRKLLEKVTKEIQEAYAEIGKKFSAAKGKQMKEEMPSYFG